MNEPTTPPRDDPGFIGGVMTVLAVHLILFASLLTYLIHYVPQFVLIFDQANVKVPSPTHAVINVATLSPLMLGVGMFGVFLLDILVYALVRNAAGRTPALVWACVVGLGILALTGVCMLAMSLPAM